MAIKTKDKTEKEETIERLKAKLETGTVIQKEPAPDPVEKDPGVIKWDKSDIQPKTTLRMCIVIDKEDRWHQTKVDLAGVDTSAYTWGYYGSNYPVLVETDNGKLEPWYLPDSVGESSNRLYKAANPEGFRNTFKHRSTMLHKIQIGLMVMLVLGILFLIFIMSQQ